MHLEHTVTVGDTAIELDISYSLDGTWDIDSITIGGLDAYELYYTLPDERRDFAESIQAAVDAALEPDADADDSHLEDC